MAILTMGDLIKAATTRWPGLRDRAARVYVQGIKTGFRSDWSVPDAAYGTGVQEVSFTTLASDSKTDRRFRKPYKTVFRFPLNPATGNPYPPGTGTEDLPVWVSCSCPSFQFYCEVALNNQRNSDIIHSDGSFPRVNNPSREPIICKHILATVNSAAQKRKNIPVTAEVTGEDPAKVTNRDTDNIPFQGKPKRQTPTDSLTASNPKGLPQTWLGRLVYILFGERTTR